MSAVPDLSPTGQTAVEAVRATVDVLDGAVTVGLPPGLAARRVEVVLLPTADDAARSGPSQRWPAP